MMKPLRNSLFLCLVVLLTLYSAKAQDTAHTQQYATLFQAEAADRDLVFSMADTGVYLPLSWGLDLAWLSHENIRRGIAFMGKENLSLIRSSFTPTAPLQNGELPTSERNTLNRRLNILRTLPKSTQVVLNCDHPSVDDWYIGHPERWVQLIELTARKHQEAGYKVVTVSPFNEPDYGWGQGTQQDFYQIAALLQQRPIGDTVRISGGNTLNCDEATPWFNALKPHLDEGNTHQLAGSFDGYARFYTMLAKEGYHATNDELHNVMEAMVGAEYGMQTGIWWGTAERTRGDFVKASAGRRLAYAEHRPNWTAASVYRSPEGVVKAFIGSSERQAKTTRYRLVSANRNVFFDGHGPQREYVVTLPGGNGYQQGQTNAECQVRIDDGDDIQPIIDGQYVLVNKASKKVLSIAGASNTAGANICVMNYASGKHQQWEVHPVDARIGGDFSYHSVCAMNGGKSIDVQNYSLENNANIILYDPALNANQQWFLDYAGEGWFYVRSRHSAKCLEQAVSGNNVQQGEKAGLDRQLWRMLPLGAPLEFEAPPVPTGLSIQAASASFHLSWTPSDKNLSYTVLRGDSLKSTYHTLAKDLSSDCFVDNTIVSGQTYYYCLRATDNSLNNSPCSDTLVAYLQPDNRPLLRYDFEQSIDDVSGNFNHALSSSTPNYVRNDDWGYSLSLTGKDYLQLPADLLNTLPQASFSLWINWRYSLANQVIYYCEDAQNRSICLQPRNNLSKCVLSYFDGKTRQTVQMPMLSRNQWNHLAVCFDSLGVRLYLNGQLAVEQPDFRIDADFHPFVHYLGKGNASHVPLTAWLDEVQFFPVSLSQAEVARLAQLPTSVQQEKAINRTLRMENNWLYLNSDSAIEETIAVYSLDGTCLYRTSFTSQVVIDATRWPKGPCVVRWQSSANEDELQCFVCQ